MTRLLYDKSQAAEQLSISERVLDRLISEGQVLTVTIGRRRLVPADCLAEYVARLKEAA